MVQEQIAHENPDELFCRAVAGDFKACDDLMRNFPGYVFRKYKAGDKDSVFLLWRHFEPEAKRHVKLNTSNKLQARFDASEILQVVNESLLEKRPDPTQSELGQKEAELDEAPRKTIETYPQLKAWYMRIVANRLIDRIRTETAQYQDPNREAPPIAPGCASSMQRFEPRADDSTASQRAIKNEEMLLVQKAIEILPEGEEKIRSIYRLREGGLTYSQIADQLGLGSISKVEDGLKKAKKMIRAELGIRIPGANRS